MLKFPVTESKLSTTCGLVPMILFLVPSRTPLTSMNRCRSLTASELGNRERPNLNFYVPISGVMAILQVPLALPETAPVRPNIHVNRSLVCTLAPRPTRATIDRPPNGDKEPLIPRSLPLTLVPRPLDDRQATPHIALNISFRLARQGDRPSRTSIAFMTSNIRNGNRYPKPPPPTTPP